MQGDEGEKLQRQKGYEEPCAVTSQTRFRGGAYPIHTPKRAAIEERWVSMCQKRKVQVRINPVNETLILEFARAVGLMTDEMKGEARAFIEQQYLKLKNHYAAISSESSSSL